MTGGPVIPQGHGVPLRGLESTPASSTTTGRFGRMFRHLPPATVSDTALLALGRSMIQDLEDGKLDKPLGTDDDDENVAVLDGALRLPAGYTYFGQFVDHDITFDPMSSFAKQNDPDALTDFRTPRFDLDSLYGRGPADQPYMYAPDGLHLALGETLSANPSTAGPDLQRGAGGRAITGDPRNDENKIVSQLQVAFIQFHNRVVDQVIADHPTFSAGDQLELAQRTVRWHYQWVVIHDFLVRLVGQDVVDDLLPQTPYKAPGATDTAQDNNVARSRRLFYEWTNQPYMPVEFSVAAYRFGHSMARPSYLINDVIPMPVVDNAARIPLFRQNATNTQDLNGFGPIPADWGVQWKYLLAGINEPAGPNDARLPQPSYKLDATLSNPLGALPASTAAPEMLFPGQGDASFAQVLAFRNLLRGQRLGLPSGQDVARAMGLTPLETDVLFDDAVTIDADAKTELAAATPLWFYILKEAEKTAGAAHLGPVGGRIVAEVLIGLLDGDPLSYLSVDPTWTPILPAAAPGGFTLSDLVNFARPDVNPTPAPPPPYQG